jgi:hypothetical protein
MLKYRLNPPPSSRQTEKPAYLKQVYFGMQGATHQGLDAERDWVFSFCEENW